MKGLGFSTILLAFVTVLILISTVLMGFVTYRTTVALDAVKANEFFSANKLLMLSPTVMNVVSMAVLGALFAIG